ncbi:MAG: hypothetical protein ABIH59_03485 [archaeon]
MEMVKILNLHFNSLQKIYYYFEGPSQDPKKREEYKREELISVLKKRIDFNRKSCLYLSGISKNLSEEISGLLKGTKVSLEEKISL